MLLKLLELLLGPEPGFTLEQRLLNGALFCSAGAATLLCLSDMMLRLGPEVWLFSLSSSLTIGGLYLLGRMGFTGQWLTWALFSSLGAAAIYAWIAVGGHQGAAPLILVCMAAVVPALFQGSHRIAAWMFVLLEILALFEWQRRFPDWVRSIRNHELHIHDVEVSLLLVGAGISGMVSLVVYNYRQQRVRTQELNDALRISSQALEERNQTLSRALEEIRALRGIIPICSHCKKVRNDDGLYEAVEKYISRHSDADFSHTICPDCISEYYSEYDDDSPADSH
ncbi:MAG: hypothetical protein H6678_14560 [Candidatus Delongbacteria bacterium]|nr:hypothetical protein [Candidatus Delongbacteria bacterium]